MAAASMDTRLVAYLESDEASAAASVDEVRRFVSAQVAALHGARVLSQIWRVCR